MAEGVAGLKARILLLEEENTYLRACVECFFSGDIPESASIDQIILATAGRERLERKARQAALLAPSREEVAEKLHVALSKYKPGGVKVTT